MSCPQLPAGVELIDRIAIVSRGRRQGRTENIARRNGPDMGTIGFYFKLASAAPADRVLPVFIDLYNAEWVTRPPRGECETAPASPAAGGFRLRVIQRGD